jgi:phosphotransferase system HPr (HPr) family protein
MVEEKVVIMNDTGLHARPAANLVKEATKYPCDIRIRKGSKEIDLKSILGLLSLGVGKGDEVTIIVDGRNEKEIIKVLVEYIKNLEN